MKKVLFLVIFVIFGFRLYSMQRQELSDMPQEIKLHILSFLKADTLIELFKEIASVSGTQREMRDIMHDPVILKNIINQYFQEQLKTKSLESIAPEIGQAMMFIHNQFIKNRDTTLLQAINTAFKSVIQDLARKYLNSIGLSTENLNQELINSARSGNLNKTILLLAANADPNIKDRSGYTALIWATIKNHPNIAKVLLASNADPNIKDYIGYTALIWASITGRTDIVKALLAANADLNIQDRLGHTALIWASRNGHIDIVKALLAANADLNIKTNFGETALDQAKEKSSKKIVELIQEHLSKNKK